MKKCSRCKEEKLLTCFSNCKTGSQGKQGYCKDCQRITGRIYDQKRKTSEQRKRYQKNEWQKRKDDPKYKIQHKKWLEENAEHVKAKAREYYLNNRDRVTANRANDRAKRKGSWGRIDTDKWVDVITYAQNKCCACGSEPNEQEVLSLDHVIPLSCGGDNVLHNSQPLCKRCNIKKGKNEIDFRSERFNKFIQALCCGTTVG